MSVMTAISAFSYRNARRGAVWQLLLYSGGLATLLVLLSAWYVSQADSPPGGTCYWDGCPHLVPMQWSVLALADIFALGVCALGLFVIAPAMVAAAVAAERRAGTLDQLRTTPLSPLGLLAGILVGTPAKLYLLLAGPLALHVVCGLTGVIPADSMLSSLCVLVTGGLASTIVGLAVALAPKQETGGALVAVAVAGVLALGGFIAGGASTAEPSATWSFLHPGGALSATLLQHDTLWRRLAISPWHWQYLNNGSHLAELGMSPLLSSISSLALAVVLGAACCRKLAAPHLPLLSKKSAIVLFAGIAAAAVLPARFIADGPTADHNLEVALLFSLVLLPVMAGIGLFATPSVEAWTLGLRREKRLSPFHDDAAPHVTMWAMGLLLALMIGVALTYDDPVHFRAWYSLSWTWWMIFTLPIFIHFGATRYGTAAARWGFGVAIFAHLVCQTVALLLILDRDRNLELTYVRVAAFAGLVVPLWVALRQHALRRRTLAAR
jgi:hypothetical protein